ncbi:MAG TPA: hemolysin [Bacteroidales bacterium]|nr:hemolysin [Bacteroidales bacterium]
MVGLVTVVFLLFVSALVSGSEVAYFSMLPNELEKLRDSTSRASKRVIHFIEQPERLLATILVTNNFVNVGIVVLSTFLTSQIFEFSTIPDWLGFTIQIVAITFLILFFSEILPKVYANRYAISFARFTSSWLAVFTKLFWPVSSVLINSTHLINKKLQRKKSNISIDELSDALELTEVSLTEEKNILKGIVKFGNIDVSEIMRSRVDVVGVDVVTPYNELLTIANESGYSRIPVYEESFDKINGILYIKDLLPHLNKPSDFTWQKLIREPYFVPESKKINDLLKEFQLKHIHLAIVVDEYGGTSGIVTLEDILEEIVGEITDESDAEELPYTKIDDNNIIFEGKTFLNDFYKVANVNDDVFDRVKGDADTLAGLILELRGEIPQVKDKLAYKNFVFEVLEVDNRRIIRIHVHIKR